MSQVDFETLLQVAMGLDAASIGSSAVEHAVKTRMSACEIKDPSAYWNLVCTSATELQALIEAVIVSETWFFRDREAFAELARTAKEDWLPACPDGTLQLLSLPCSSGEEPYSMAMALLDAGFPINRCRIDAVDISAQALNAARGALYGKNSFRGAELSFRDRYFETTELGSRLSGVVRRQVHFQQGNVFADDFLPGEEIYDIIFCRNLLIYFDRATQDRAVGVLQRLLKPKGVLFLGPSEGGLLLDHGFVSSKVLLAFAFRRRGAEPHALVPSPTRPKTAPLSSAHTSSPTRPLKPNGTPRPNSAAEPPAPIAPAINEAFSLADQGHMAEAAKSCEEHLRKHGPSVQSFFLMGLIRAAAGSLSEAGKFYRKALYLDQNHHDTLVHLGLLLEKQGDATGAQVVRDRLQRLQHKRIA
jgi:chemotaxis protein methyltransferase WspC